MAVLDKLKGVWNAFASNEQRSYVAPPSVGPSSGHAPDRVRVRIAADRSTLAAIYNRIAIDFASVEFRHVMLDDQKRYLKDLESGLQSALTYQANTDQPPRAFRQDIALSLFDAGVIAIVAVDAMVDKRREVIDDVLTLRVGTITEWFPEHVRVNVFNEKVGRREDIIVRKSMCAIVQNPLYLVMNEPNSTLQRLHRKLGLLDYVDEQSSSGKLDLIIQLPYVVRSEARKQQAEQRREDIEFQLRDSKYGIAYTDGTEKITQLNRPIENDLLTQVDTLIEKLYAELGITAAVMNGTADDATMVNYHNRTIYPLAESVQEAMQVAFIGPGRTALREKVFFIRAKMQFLTLKDMGEVVDKLLRNEVASSNEARGWVGMPPSTEPKADKLINSNMPQPADSPPDDEI